MTSSKPDTSSKLTAKQRAFVDAYTTNGFNATQAAIKAGYSVDSAHTIGYENIRKPEIKEEIRRIMDEHTMTASEVLSRLTEHARGDIGDIWDETTGRVDWVKARALGKTPLIKRFKSKTTRTTREDGTDIETFEDEIELHSPQTALQLLGKQHGLFVERTETKVTAILSWADMIQQAHQPPHARDDDSD